MKPVESLDAFGFHHNFPSFLSFISPNDAVGF